MPNAPGRLSNPREAWEQLIEQAFKNEEFSVKTFFYRAALELLLDIREMAIVQNLMTNQQLGLLAKATDTPVEKRAGGVIIP